MTSSAVAALGHLLQRAGSKLETWHQRAVGQSPSVFETPDALRLNQARLDHLASLGIDVQRKRVIEVGAGIGLLGEFFETRGCHLLSTEGREDNLAEMRRRFPQRQTRQVKLDRDADLSALGHFDFAFCYGTLYHLANPESALTALAGVADALLLETCLTPGSHIDVHLVREGPALDQALGGVGCRPTRPWIMDRLKRLWGFAYTTVDQPNHPDFEIDWKVPYKHGNHRAVFVASRTPLTHPKLVEVLPDRQSRFVE